MSAFNETPTTHLPPGILNKHNVQNVQNLDVIELEKLTIDHIEKRRISLSMESITEDAALKSPIAEDFNSLSVGNKHVHRRYDGFLSSVSPDYKINRNFLSLTKVPNVNHKQAIMFVFLMNNNRYERKRSSSDINTILKDNPRTRMHVLWPGSKKINLEQKIIADEYPVDISIANKEDGYAQGEWNLVLPNKKPREVRVSLLWSF